MFLIFHFFTLLLTLTLATIDYMKKITTKSYGTRSGMGNHHHHGVRMSRSARSGLPTMGGTTGNSAVGDLLDLTGTGGGEDGGDTLDLNGRHLPPLPPSCHNTAPLSSSAASLDRFM